MLDKAKVKGVVESYGSMHEHYHNLKTVRDIPLFYGDQWEITVPSLLGIDQDNPAKRDFQILWAAPNGLQGRRAEGAAGDASSEATLFGRRLCTTR